MPNQPDAVRALEAVRLHLVGDPLDCDFAGLRLAVTLLQPLAAPDIAGRFPERCPLCMRPQAVPAPPGSTGRPQSELENDLRRANATIGRLNAELAELKGHAA